jgi:hypothetical protein
MLQRDLHQPIPKPLQLRLGERPKPGMRADEQPVLDTRWRAHRVVEDRSGRDVERVGEQAERVRRRAREILRDEPQPPQRPELQRDPQLIGSATLPAHEPKIIATKPEEPSQLAAIDALRERLQPRDLSIGEKPRWHQ